jgi:glycosyltransferase involved in cell wall biosynthesis
MELVSVIIPTLNSISTIAHCLDSVKNQTYLNTEIIVIDNKKSTDGTKEYCEKRNVRVFKTDWKLLGARYEGLAKSSGEYILLIDSDQFLQKTCIQSCVEMIRNGLDMLFLEEKSFEPKTFIQKIYASDRRLMNEYAELQRDPLSGPAAPRFYRRSVLENAFAAIPKEILPFTIAGEDAIMYFEASKISQKMGIVRDALWHQDPKTFRVLWNKNKSYGRSARELKNTGHYNLLLSKKITFRRAKGISKNRILSILLLSLKGPPFFIGFYSR